MHFEGSHSSPEHWSCDPVQQLGAAAGRRPRAASRPLPPAASSRPYWEQDNWGVSDSSYHNGDGQHEAGGWDASTSGQHEANGWDANGHSTHQANGRSTHHQDDPYDGGYGYGQPSSSAYRYDSPYDNEPSYDGEPAWGTHESYQDEAVRASAHDREQLAPGEPAPSYGRGDVQSAIASNPLFTPQFMNVLQVSGAGWPARLRAAGARLAAAEAARNVHGRWTQLHSPRVPLSSQPTCCLWARCRTRWRGRAAARSPRRRRRSLGAGFFAPVAATACCSVALPSLLFVPS